MISELFGQKLLEVQMQMAEAQENEETNEEVLDVLHLIKRKIDKQRTIVEKYINACLFERV